MFSINKYILRYNSINLLQHKNNRDYKILYCLFYCINNKNSYIFGDLNNEIRYDYIRYENLVECATLDNNKITYFIKFYFEDINLNEIKILYDMINKDIRFKNLKIKVIIPDYVIITDDYKNNEMFELVKIKLIKSFDTIDENITEYLSDNSLSDIIDDEIYDELEDEKTKI